MTSMVEELRENLRRIAHLSHDEQLCMFEDQLKTVEQFIAGNEQATSADLSEHSVRRILERGVSNLGRAQAKKVFAEMFNKQIENSKEWNQVFSIWKEKFPSSSRISTLAKRQEANHRHLLALQKIVEDM